MSNDFSRVMKKILDRNSPETSLIIPQSVGSEGQINQILENLPQNSHIQELTFLSKELCNIHQILTFVVQRPTITSIRFQDCPVSDYDMNEFAKAMLAAPKDRPPLKLKVANGKIGPDGCGFLTEVIQKECPIAQVALISNPITDSACKDLVSVIGLNPYLKSVILEGVGFEAMSSCHLVDALDENNVIEELSLAGKFTNNCAIAVKLLIENPNAKIKRVSFNDNKLTTMFIDNLFPSIRKAVSLQSISLAKCELNFDSVTTISKSIDCQMSLQSLDLSNTSIGQHDVAQLAVALMHQSTLRSLNLSNNPVKSFGAWALFHALQNNLYLQELNLKNTELDDESCQSLTEFLDKNKTLKVLEIGYNSFSEKELQNFSNRLSKSFSLQLLDISNNKTDPYKDTMSSIFDLAETSHTLKRLIVGGNALGPKSVNSLVRMIKNNRTLKSLKLSNCSLTPELGLMISEAIANNYGLRDIDITQNNLDEISENFAQALTTNASLCYFSMDTSSKNPEIFRRTIERNRTRYISSIYHDFEQLAKDHCFM
ncbi:Leucine Rich Repeat family protein [Trichomonas vaginalis G3]|uniref:Leucine Rich Repeat family protein n=1 Tax=Trichomonas vaginalis (strain ATCC PRA-98 / G3) TaxID=412133 RepID=A2F1T7_TRIV3|nr:uncharacterized protein TVAGG3_0038040 [Trichomonas vaginalis G3]EAY01137.1 Leucine Rich Repeat family protein [Trichomonas vaginalis G3]KAI5540524.1 interleukin-8 biosynthetic process [Trichomonas vaginalis G3]|eukprot:XP_001313989.1 hypothetical protein [Trichomonas vaginalis G3]